jgi:hypothetical protein
MRTFREPGPAKAYEQHLTGNGPSLIGDCGYIGVAPLTPYKNRNTATSPPPNCRLVGMASSSVREWLRTRGWCAT